jgi:hypothetical protein
VRSGPGRRAATVVGALAVALAAAGCVSLPTGGPVRSYSVTQGADAQSQQYVQVQPQPPRKGWSPAAIVQGFLAASATFGDQGQVARQYLTPQESASWTPTYTAIVYKEGPDVTGAPTVVPGTKNTTVTVRITGKEQAYLQGFGSYSVPSASAQDQAPPADQVFTLVKVGTQWRIAKRPGELLLTSDSFNHDYQQRNLYFFDPSYRYLVPDPVYVPLQASEEDLMNGLVNDLIRQPTDWLSNGAATRTRLPAGTRLAGVTLDGGLAAVNLTGTIVKAAPAVLAEVSSQLLWTLSSNAQNGTSGQAVQSVELELDGHPWTPPNAQGNPVQRPSSSAQQPPAGGGGKFYYVDSAGYLVSRDGVTGKPVRIEPAGADVRQLAVSADGRYVALVRGNELYTGLAGGALSPRGTGYLSLSWDASDDLWASTSMQIYLFRGSRALRQPLGQRVMVNVSSDDGLSLSGPFAALRVAPDGVRVAIVLELASSEVVTIGAISGQQGASPQLTLSRVQLAPPGGATTFTGLSWYGPDHVITLATPGPAVTEYLVSGGSTTSLPVDPGMESVSASWSSPLLAAVGGVRIAANASLSGSWTALGRGSVPVYPG